MFYIVFQLLSSVMILYPYKKQVWTIFEYDSVDIWVVWCITPAIDAICVSKRINIQIFYCPVFAYSIVNAPCTTTIPFMSPVIWRGILGWISGMNCLQYTIYMTNHCWWQQESGFHSQCKANCWTIIGVALCRGIRLWVFMQVLLWKVQ